jgi:hypothetical protein
MVGSPDGWLAVWGFSSRGLGLRVGLAPADVGVLRSSDFPLILRLPSHERAYGAGGRTTGVPNIDLLVFGEPDIAIEREDGRIVVEVRGVDVYDPTTGQVRSSSVESTDRVGARPASRALVCERLADLYADLLSQCSIQLAIA